MKTHLATRFCLAAGLLLIACAATPAATFTVTNVSDTGPGSLRDAILNANVNAGTLDTIAFNIAGAGPHTIQPQTPLPTITGSVRIDGYLQPGAAMNSSTNGLNMILKIELDGTLAGATTTGLVVSASTCTIQGLVINRFCGDGIAIINDADFITIQGNFIGTDVTGTLDRGNGRAGIRVDGDDNSIGGTFPLSRNLISGNDSDGVIIEINGSGNSIDGNLIGTDKNGNPILGNGVFLLPPVGAGILLEGCCNAVGVRSGNLIADNAEDGIFVGAAGTRNDIRGNLIFANGDLGIDLANAAGTGGPNGNDPCDADMGGGNDNQNYPVLTSSVSDPMSITIGGFLESVPTIAAFNFPHVLEFFASTQCDPSGNGEAQMFLGRTNLMLAAGSCSSTFLVTLPTPTAVAGGMVITATASRFDRTYYNTSEFSQCFTNLGPAGPVAVTIAPPQIQNNSVLISWTAPGGTTSFVQAAATLSSAFANISPAIILPPGSAVTTNYVDPGVLTNRSANFYRILVR